MARDDRPAGERTLDELTEALASLRFDLSHADAAGLRSERDRVRRQLYGLVERAARPDAPLLVVVGGGSGAGKSTLVNTLAGEPVAAVGVRRPTTHAPLLVCHPDDRGWFDDEHVLADLPRTEAADDDGATAGRRLVVAERTQLPTGVALLDTPDIDSVEARNRLLADDALDVADAWLWVTTPRTYADAVGVDYLRRARARQALTALVMAQVRPNEQPVVVDDAAEVLRRHDAACDERFVVPHAPVEGGRLPDLAVAEICDWLTGLAPADARAEVREGALAGAHAALPDELAPLRAALEAERAAAARLRTQAREAFRGVRRAVEAELDAGVPLRADVLERWRDLVGTSETLLRVQSAAQRLGQVVRDATGRGGADAPRRVRAEVGETLTEILRRRVTEGHHAAVEAWRRDPVGRDLLAASPALATVATDLDERARGEVYAWQAHVADLVATRGAERRTRARRLSTGLNAVATSAILVLFAASGGLTGGEVGIAAAASAASQALLVKLFGEQNLRQLLGEARADLLARADAIAEEQAARFVAIVDDAAPGDEAVAAVEAATPGARA